MKFFTPLVVTCLIFLSACHGKNPKTTVTFSAAPAKVDAFKARIDHAKKKVFPALVTIFVYADTFRGGRKVVSSGVGSGTIVSEEGYVITNAHVTQSASRYRCVLSNKQEVSATLIGEDYATDLAVLKLHLDEAPGFKPVPVARFGHSEDMNIGDVVLAMGSPRGLSRSITMGVISNTERQLGSGSGEGLNRIGRRRSGQYTNLIQHDALISPGNSGGPLVNLEGEIIGINELGGTNLFFAIPSDIASRVYQELVRHGRVIRSHLGFSIGTIKGTGESEGLLVLNVEEDSPAGKAGLMPGDFVLSFNGEPVTARYLEDLAPIYRKATEVPIGRDIVLKVKRGDSVIKLDLTTRELEDDWSEEREFRAWGMTCANISPLLARDAFLKSREGVYVTGARDLAATAKPGISRMVIRSVNGKAIKNLDDFSAIYKEYAQRKDTYRIVFEVTDGAHSIISVMKHKKDKDKDPEDVKRAWVGLTSQVLTSDLRRALELEKGTIGVRIIRIFPNTKAEESELKVGDVITHVGDIEVEANKESHTQVFPQIITQFKVDETVPFKVIRQGETQKVNVTLESAPLEQRLAKKVKDKEFEFSVRNITFYDIIGNRWPKATTGVIIADSDSKGWTGGKLTSGRLLLSINDRKITDLETFKKVMDDIKKEKPERVRFLLKGSRFTSVIYIKPEWES